MMSNEEERSKIGFELGKEKKTLNVTSCQICMKSNYVWHEHCMQGRKQRYETGELI